MTRDTKTTERDLGTNGTESFELQIGPKIDVDQGGR